MTIFVFKIDKNKEVHPVYDYIAAKSFDDISRKLPQGVYSTFRTYDSSKKVIGLTSHLMRLYVPSKNTSMPPVVSELELRRILRGLLIPFRPDDTKIRISLLPTGRFGEIYLMIEKFYPPENSIYRNGVRTITSKIGRDTPRIKTTSFIEKTSSERAKIAKNQIYEILMIKNDAILEGFTSNFFTVLHNKIITANTSILLGVTRKIMIRLLRTLNYDIEFRPVKISELPDASETFITSSSRGIVSVVAVDDQIIGDGIPGIIAGQLNSEYQNYVMKHAKNI